MKKIITLCFLMALLCVKGWGQAASATWTLTSTTTPTVTGNITATTPTFGGGLANTGINNANYGIYANNWPTTSTTPAPASSTQYFQFSVTPTGSNTLNITSLTLGYYDNESFFSDGLAIFYSTSSTFATSTQVIANSSQISTFSGSYTNSAIAATAAAGQTLYFRIYFYYASSSSIYFGARSLALSGTTASTTPTLSATALAAFGSICTGATAGSNSFTITGTNLTAAPIAVGSLTGYTFSTAAAGSYLPSLSLTHAAGSYSQAIYVKFTPPATGSYNGPIPVSGGGAATINVAASGTGVNSPPTATSGTVNSITYNSATVGGSITAGCAATTGYGIEYSTTNGFANGSGTQVPSSNLSGGTFSSNLTGLAPNTTYYFHAYATSSGGTTYGTQGNFTTAALTYIDSWISMSTGSTNWCAGETRTISVTVKNNGTATWTSGPTGVNFSYYWSNQNRDFNNRLLPFAGLVPGQQQTITFSVTAPSAGTYTLNFDLVKEQSCWFADNVSGCSGPGNIVYPSASQTIGALPTVATAAATSVTINSATVPGTITAGCAAITGYGIEYSTTNNFANGTGTAVAGSNLSGSNYTVNLTGLSQSTTYYYHAFVNYSVGVSYSAQGSFITLTPTLSASALAAFGNVCTGTTAGPNTFTITGSNLTAVNIAVGPLTGYTFSTATAGPYSASLSLTHAAGSYSPTIYVKFTPTAVQSYSSNIPVSGGGAATINVAASGSGVNLPPTVTAGTAGSITAASATISGNTISSIGCSSVSAYGIEYSTTNNFAVGSGTRVAGTGFSGSSGGGFTTTLSGLSANTLYYYRAFATNSGGTSYSSTQGSFSTLCATVASFPFTETFETSSATSNCWSSVYVSGTQNWGYIYGSYSGNVSAPHTGSYDASFNDEFYTTAVTKLVSPVLNLTALSATGARVRFWYQNPYTFDFFDDYHDQLKVYYRTTSTGAWTLIPNAVYKDDIGSWTQVSLILPFISSTYQIAFEGSVDPDFSGYLQSGDLAIDDITIEATPPPPANDDCIGAVALTVNSTCSATPGTTVNATLSQAAATCSGSTGVADDDVWYKFIANNTTASVAVSTVSSTLDPVIQAFSGTCGSLASLACVDVNSSGSGETLSLSGLTVGATYYIRVYGYGSDISTQGTFNICVTGTCLAPVAYSVTGGGAYCTGGTGVAVGLSNSQAGYSYQLQLNGTATGSAVAGTGSAISFGNQTAAGTYTVVATNNGSSGCSTTMTGSATVSINPNVVAGTVSGTTPLCIGGTNTYTSNGTTGGTWTSTVTGVATVNASTGAVTAVGAGTTNITYTVSSGCGSPVSASKTLTVSPNATAGTVSGTTPLCIGSTTTYTISGNSSPGTWSSTATAVATVNASTGAVTAVSTGTATITYTVSTGCNNPVSAFKTVSVSPNATAGTITGASPLCIGVTSTYTSNGNTGGAWSSNNTGVATVNVSTGAVTAVSTGTATITYTVSSGCNNPVSASKTLTVGSNATAGTVSGTTPLCINTTATYISSGDAGGVWSSTNTNIATINASTGAVTAIAAGTTDITYTVSTGCNAPVSASKTLTVSPNANAGTVSGTSPLCIGVTATYTSSGNTGGTWSSSNTSVATVNASTGVVTSVAAGTTSITYTVSTGCNNPVNTSKSLTVSPNATAGTVSGATPLCTGVTVTYISNGNTGGVWTSTNTAVATVNASTGAVTAIGAGTTNITYTVSTGCNAPISSFQSLTVNQTPVASIETPPYTACDGSAPGITFSGTANAAITYTLTLQGGGNISTTPVFIPANGDNVTIPAQSGEGVYTYTITSVSTGNSCTGTITNPATTVTINPVPVVAAITGPGYIALTKTGDYTNSTTGGIWAITNDPTGSASIAIQSGNPATATVQASTNNVGTPTLTYTVSNQYSCSTTVSKTIQVFDNTITRYRSIQDGKASEASTWEVLNDNNQWVSTQNPPDNNSNIEVRHNVKLEEAEFDGTDHSSVTITSHVEGSTTVSGTLTIYPAHFFQSQGSVNFNDKSVTLLSDQTGTAAIGVMKNPIANATNVTVHRFTDAKKSASTTGSRRAWRLITSPVTGQTIHEAWQENATLTNLNPNPGYGTLITGEGFTNATVADAQGYDYIGGGNHTSIEHYVIGGGTGGTNAWLPLSSDNSSTGTNISLQTEQAYMLFVRGNRTIGASNSSTATLRSTGMLQQGTQSSATIQTGAAYTLVGNPYASAIDFGKFIVHNNNLKDQFYSWNSTIGTYGAYVLVTHTGTGSNQGGYVATPSAMSGVNGQQNDDDYKYIPNGSGFFVSPATPATTGTISFEEGDKAAGQVPPINPFRVVPDATNVQELLVNLNQKDSDTSATLADGFRAKFSPDYEGNEEDNSNAKVYNFNENLNLVRGGKAHIIEARGEVKKTDTLYMKMWYVTKRNYQLQMRADNFTSAPGIQAWLVDNYSGTKQEISLAGNVVSFDFSVNADSLSSKSDRFMIVFQNNSAVLPVTLTNVKAILQNSGVNVSWTVTNEVNMKGYTVERSADGGRTYTAVATQAAKNGTSAIVTSYAAFDAQPKTGDNLYRIRIEGKDGSINYSSVVSVTIGASGNIEIAVYPNPVRDGKVSLQLSNLKPGTYLAAVYSEGGQSVYQKKITISQPNTTQSEELKLGKAMAQGSYQLRISDSKGNTIKETKLIVGR